MTLRAPFLLRLCEAAHDSRSSLGLVIRFNTQYSTFAVDATKLIHSLIEFSPAKESVAIEFLHEFQKISHINHLVTSLLTCMTELDADQWAQSVLAILSNLSQQLELSAQLEPVLNLAYKYLAHLLVTVQNPGGAKYSRCLSTNVNLSDAQIQALIDEATDGEQASQAALKELIFARDGYTCPLTDLNFDQRVEYVMSYCAHILPVSLHDKPASLHTIQTFSGMQIDTILKYINHPCNAFNLQGDAHVMFDRLAWGIEAVAADGKVKYIFREMAPSALTIRRCDGDEVTFNKGKDGEKIDGPDPVLCNLKLAISRALRGGGGADIIDQIYHENEPEDDEEDIDVTQPVYFGEPSVSDEVLRGRL